MKQYKCDAIFPTNVLQIDFSDVITKEDQELMTKSVDELIEGGCYEKTPYHPKYQTKFILFNDSAPKIWLKLKQTFIESCYFYIKNVDHFTNNTDSMRVIDTHAWCYKGWKSLNEEQNNPWHNHNPAFLAGVFYLKIPNNANCGGTELGDPRFPECQGTRNFMTSPMEFTWSIFPGWLPHRSVYIDSEEPRYVIAANAYCSPNHE